MKKSINNSIKAFAMAAIATMFSMSITSCGDDDDVLPDTQKVEEPETTDTPIPASVSFETKGDGDGSVTPLSGDTFYVGDTISVSVNVADQNSELAMDGVNVNGGRILSNKDNTYTIVLDAENASVYATFNKINKTYGLVVNEMSMKVASSCEVYPDRSVLIKDNHMEIVGGKTEVRKGDSFSVKFNLFYSYVVKSVKVNGVDMTSNVKDNVLNVDVNNDIVNGKDDITIDAVYDMNLTFKVTAEFTNDEKTEVVYHITPSVEGVKYFFICFKSTILADKGLMDGNDISATALHDFFAPNIRNNTCWGVANITKPDYKVDYNSVVVLCRMDKDCNFISPVIACYLNEALGIK